MYPWQQSQLDILRAQLQSGKLPHALLFSGQAGLGKVDFTRELVADILCEAPIACGHCPSCHWLGEGHHPDLFWLEPEEVGKAIKVDQVRGLIEKLSKTSQQGGYQVAVITPANAMNTAAANALLKTLEEPAGNVIIILVSDQAGFLPATILSRCQKIHFLAPTELALPWLQHKLGADAPVLLRLAQGAPLRALTLSEVLPVRTQLLKTLYGVFAGKLNPVDVATGWSKENVSLLLDLWAQLLQDMLTLRLGGSAEWVTHQDALKGIHYFAERLTAVQLAEFSGGLQTATCEFSGPVHLNVQLLLENVLIQWSAYVD